jgi:hypothetical protein
MNTIKKKAAAAALAISLVTGSITYPTQEAHAGVGIAVVGALATNGTGTILLPEGVGIAAMLGGVALFGVTCFTMLENMEPGNYKGALLAFSLIFLDKGMKNENLRSELRQKLVSGYRNYDLNENDADLLAEIIINKINLTQIKDQSNTEILFSPEEISQVVDSIFETNPALALKISNDFTQTSIIN